MRRLPAATPLLAAALFIGAPAQGDDFTLEAVADLSLLQDEPDELAGLEPLSDWSVQVEPLIWYAGLFGDVQIAGSPSTETIENMNLDEPEVGAGRPLQDRVLSASADTVVRRVEAHR